MGTLGYFNWDTCGWFVGKDDATIAHTINLESQLLGMFECDGMDANMFRQIEQCFFRFGECGYTVFSDGQHYADVCTLQGKLDLYGYPSEGYIIARDGYTKKQGKIGEDIVLGWNTDLRVPNLDLYRYAKMLAEIDTSIKVNVINSRLHKIPVASNSEQKHAIDKVVKNIKDGKSETILNKVAFRDLIADENGVLKLDVLELTDVHDIETVQYLSKLYNDMLARFWQMYGHDMQSTAKMAQQNETELQGIESYSMILPQNMLKCRKKFAEDINARFGTNYKYHFSPAWTWALENKSHKLHDADGILNLDVGTTEEFEEEEDEDADS